MSLARKGHRNAVND